MSLSYAQIEATVAALHDVPPIRMGALKARLKHLKRLGFPPGANTGQGRHVRYTAGDLALLLTAFELIQQGLPPERVVGMLRVARRSLPTVFRMVAVGLERPPGESPHFHLVAHISALEGDEFRDGQSVLILDGRDTAALFDGNEDGGCDGRRLTILNMTMTIGAAARFLRDSQGISVDRFAAALKDWSAEREWLNHVQRDELEAEEIFGPAERDVDNGDNQEA